MKSGPRLAVFDIDGTIALHGVVPEETLKGLRHIQERGYRTTISTGRGYVRVRETLGAQFDTVVSPETLLIIEHGTKVVYRDGQVVRADYFEPNELDHVVDFSRTNADMIKLVWFMSPDPTQRVQVWCKDLADIPAEEKKRGHYADLFCCSYEELRKRLGAFPVSNVSAKLQPYVAVENLRLRFTRSDINVLFQDSMMEFVRNIADKAKAVAFLESRYDVHRSGMLVAGNAINDVDMLNIDANVRVLVGDQPETASILEQLVSPDVVVRVADPKALGVFLQTLD